MSKRTVSFINGVTEEMERNAKNLCVSSGAKLIIGYVPSVAVYIWSVGEYQYPNRMRSHSWDNSRAMSSLLCSAGR